MLKQDTITHHNSVEPPLTDNEIKPLQSDCQSCHNYVTLQALRFNLTRTDTPSLPREHLTAVPFVSAYEKVDCIGYFAQLSKEKTKFAPRLGHRATLFIFSDVTTSAMAHQFMNMSQHNKVLRFQSYTFIAA